MVKYYHGLIAALLSIAVLKLKSGKDTTARWVAKVRHCESMLENPSERLYEDPYAHQMYYGSSVQTWLGGNNTRKIFNWYLMGMFDLLTLRTKWIDDEVLKRATIVAPTTNGDDGAAEQLVILGAGYDTRGFRLDLPDGFVVVEVDQPDVQSRKRQIMTTIAKTDTTVASRMASSRVTFLAIDFNKDSISETLLMSSSSSTSLLKSTKKTIVTLEGVTQYIPEASTASTLKQIHDVFSEGTILLISYVPRSVFDSDDNKRVSWLRKVVGWFGEPWVTSWSPQSFASFLKQCGYEVLSDLSVAELNEKYLVPRNRGLARDDFLYMARYVVASVVK